jgi:hypothetical protein
VTHADGVCCDVKVFRPVQTAKQLLTLVQGKTCLFQISSLLSTPCILHDDDDDNFGINKAFFELTSEVAWQAEQDETLERHNKSHLHVSQCYLCCVRTPPPGTISNKLETYVCYSHAHRLQFPSRIYKSNS